MGAQLRCTVPNVLALDRGEAHLFSVSVPVLSEARTSIPESSSRLDSLQTNQEI